ncbi:MAG: lysine--tRNA ligase [Bacteroidota bacterium]
MKYPRFFDAQLLEKRNLMIEEGIDPYPYQYDCSHTIGNILAEQSALLANGHLVSTTGRVSSIRTAGKAVFIDLKKDGVRIQLYARKDDLGETNWKLLDRFIDLGDILWVAGTVFKTRKEELTIKLENVQMLCKAVVRIPMGKETGNKTYYKAEDPEIIFRERYTYWTISPEAKQLMELRFQIIQMIREWMQKEGFLEVQTPTIEMIYGGAEARPFETQVWALDRQKAYLRISPELYLKRYIAGGFDKVFTICQNFRNEGIDKSHNPEFTMMEWYETGTDYQRQMERFEQLTEYLVKKIHGSTEIEYQGQMLDFKVPWRRLSIVDALKEYADLDVLKMGRDCLKKALQAHEIEFPDDAPKGILITLLFEELCEQHLIQPVFIIDHPFEISPLTKAKRGAPGFVERFEPFINAMEIGNAYSEMTDPVIQYDRFAEQRNQPDIEKNTDFENHPIDLDFIKAIGVGMPPTGGVGFGIDRVIMLLTNSASIREVLPFPMMKRKQVAINNTAVHQ